MATIWHNQNACGFMYLKCFKCQTLGAFAIRHSTENECSCPNLNYQGYGKKNVSYETCQTLDPGGNAQLTNQTKPSPLVQLHFMKPPSDIMKVRFTLATQSENTFSSTSRRQSAEKIRYPHEPHLLRQLPQTFSHLYLLSAEETAPVGTSENGSRAPWGHY